MRSKIIVLTKLLLDFMFFSGIGVTLTLPLTIKFYGRYNTYFADNYGKLCVLFFISGSLAVLIIFELRKMFNTVLADDCFVKENVSSLKRMGYFSFAIAAVTSLRLLLYFTPAVCILIIVFLIAGLFSQVLSLVFDKAVTYKLENDLTI